MIAQQAAKLALGGAQFGMRYGIANANGRPADSVVDQIVHKAGEIGISLIDTAYAYGDSEAVLGRVLGRDRNIRIVTKTRPIAGDVVSRPALEAVQVAFQASLKRLRRRKVYALLVHDANDLL